MEKQLIPYSASPVPSAKNVLVLAPHPDDEVFGCGGAIALHCQAGVSVHVVLVTSGGEGGNGVVRQHESALAAELLGYQIEACWELPDRQVVYGEALVARIIEAVERTGADLIYAPSLWENHPDHRGVALAALEVVRRTDGLALMAYEVGAPLRPNFLVDISSVHELKRDAMRCFPSQLERQAYLDQIDSLNRYRTYTLGHSVIAAEAYEHCTGEAARSWKISFFASEYQRQYQARLMLSPQDAPLVSVLVRSVDRATLSKALDSIAVQTYPRVEVVVINAKGGGHTVLGGACGPFALKLANQDGPNLPRAEAANMALDIARGQYLLFLDDDDWIAPDHLEKLARALNEESSVNVAYSGVACTDAEGNLSGTFFDHPYDPARLMAGNCFPIHGVMFRLSLLERHGIRFDVDMDHYEDWDFWLQAALFGDFLHVPGISAYYRIHESSGVHDQSGVSRDASRKIYRKWRSKWPDDYYSRLMSRVWNGQVSVVLQKQELTALQAGFRDEKICLEDQANDLRNVIAEQIALVESYKGNIQKLESDIANVMGSMSWRLTEPMRRLMIFFRSIGRRVE